MAHRLARTCSVLAILCVSTLIGASAAGRPPRASANQPSRRSANPTPLLVADVSGLSAAEQLTFTALQGIVNRTAPRLYLEGIRFRSPIDFDPSSTAWLNDVVHLPTRHVTPTEVLQTFLPDVAGLVVWDPAVEYESQDLATTLAGTEDLVPIGPDQIATMTSLGYRVEQDLRDLHLTTPRAVTEWMLDHVTPPPGGWAFPEWLGRPRNGFAVQPANRDWAVAHRALVFDLDPATDQALLKRILGLFPRGTPVYGYLFFDTNLYEQTGLAINEPIAVSAITEAGLRLVPSDDASNTTVFMHLDEPVEKAPWDAPVRTPDDHTTYVSFIVSDGDNFGYDMSLMRALQTDRLSSSSIPIGVSISPELSRIAPAVWNYYVDHLPANARLVAGPSGDGYVLPMSMTDKQLAAYLHRTRTAMDANGLRSVWLLNSLFVPSPPPRQLDEYADRLDPSIIYTDYTIGAPTSPVVSFSNGVPTVHVVEADDPSQIVPAIHAAAALQPGPGPKFVAMGLTTWGNNADTAAAAMAQLGPGYVAVAPDTFAGLLQGAHASGYRGSPDTPTDAPAPTNRCTLDWDEARFGHSTYVGAIVSDLAFTQGVAMPAGAGVRPGANEDSSMDAIETRLDVSDIARAAGTEFASLAPVAFERTSAGAFTVRVNVSDLLAHLADGSTIRLSGVARSTVDQRGDPSPGDATFVGGHGVDPGAVVTRLDAQLAIDYSYDPGDGPQTSTVTVPIRCTPEAVDFPAAPTSTSTIPSQPTSSQVPASSVDHSPPGPAEVPPREPHPLGVARPASALVAIPHYTG